MEKKQRYYTYFSIEFGKYSYCGFYNRVTFYSSNSCAINFSGRNFCIGNYSFVTGLYLFKSDILNRPTTTLLRGAIDKPPIYECTLDPIYRLIFLACIHISVKGGFLCRGGYFKDIPSELTHYTANNTTI